MDRGKYIALFLVLVGALILVTGPSYAQDGNQNPSSSTTDEVQGQLDEGLDGGFELPPIEIRVIETYGRVQVRTGEAKPWRPIESGDTLGSGQELKTDAGSTTTLKIPGIALFEVQESTQISVDELRRSTETQGFLFEEEEVTVNEVSLSAEKGEVDQTFRKREGVENDYRLETPNAVAGVRGTTFECRTEGALTECTVLEGNITLSSRFTDESINLGSLQRSRITEQNPSPSEPEDVDTDAVKGLQNTRKRAEQDLALEPVIRNITVNGSELNQTGQRTYSAELGPDQQKQITLSGRAQAREDGNEIQNVRVIRDGNQLDVEGAQNWSTQLDVSGPVEASQTIELTVEAVDTQGLEASQYTLTIVLTPPETSSSVPADTKPGNYPIVLETVNGRPFSASQFPLGIQVGTDTAAENLPDLVLSGRVNVDSPVAGVAYRLDENDEWNVVGSGPDWTISVPFVDLRDAGELSFQLIAWTEDGYRSELAELGPIRPVINREGPPRDARSSQAVQVRLQTVGGLQRSPEDFPDTFTSDELRNNQLYVEGTVEADTEIEGVAYSPDQGASWVNAEGAEQWSFPLDPAEGPYELQVVAWTMDGYVSNPINVGPIFYQEGSTDDTQQEPWNYETGQVSLEVRALAGRSSADN